MRTPPTFPVLFCLLAIGANLLAVESQSRREREPDGWTDVMPPKDFAGWKRVPLEPLAKETVWRHSEDGKTLIVDGFSAKEMLLSDKQFGDGTFHVQWRILKEKPGQKMLNGGVYVRTLDNANWVQAQTAYTGGKPPRNGDLFSEYMQDGKKERRETLSILPQREKPVEEWNTYEITCKGREVALWVNGAETARWKDCPMEKGSLGFQAEYAVLEIRAAWFKAD